MLHAFGQHLDSNLLQSGTVNLAWLGGVTAEKTALEHFEGRNGQAFTTRKVLAGLLGSVGPPGACACIEENRDDEQIDQTTGPFLRIDGARPRLEQLVDARSSTNFEVLPTAMGWDRRIIGGVVSLWIKGQMKPIT